MDINLTFEDVVQYLQTIGYNEKDILYMTKEPLYSIVKRIIEAYVRVHQEVAFSNYIVEDPLVTFYIR